ncbi:polyphosphate kinase 2 [Lentilactobacillus fungorum]|uniref:Polyphosphate kinase 2 n=1 Tax=Lentilactobacillus fungorum TaxID=2201250 RepID=A0ABQ3VYY7_9LACO|nr:polyphosphate kinase 2 family protein [Lentilactobacillus fungorum]GHP13641.1 polyphosphate kinase 2 [Lentilactobacillus fungorum]
MDNKKIIDREKSYRFTGKNDFKINKASTSAVNEKLSKDDIKARIEKNIETLQDLQGKLYAQTHYGVLVVFQGMDGAGKDSMIRHILSGVNPQGCEVTSFKQPTSIELSHDYLWRIHRHVPERGMIGIFNRSYYEDVLVSRVHPQLIVDAHIGGITQLSQVDDHFYEDRFKDFNFFEDYLNRNGFMVLKFFLHMSKDEQKDRFKRRIDLPDHNWKFSSADIQERRYWDDYQKAYEDAINHTATKKNPWYIIPSDDKWYSRLCVSDIIDQRMKELPLSYPDLDPAEKQKLNEALEELKSN